MSKVMLEVKNLNFYYSEIHALKDISFTVNEGEVVTLIGANGAGKTTTMRTISGLLGYPRGGSIVFNGKDITREAPHNIAKLGLTQSLEGRQIFPGLTVAENLDMGAYLMRDKEWIKKQIEEVYEIFPRLYERRTQMGGTLSGGEQQMLAIGRALMSNPKLLMLDEPSLGLAPLIIKEIFSIIEKINKLGITILLVEQNSKAALHVADRGYVLENGRITMTDTAENLLSNPEVQRSYLGI